MKKQEILALDELKKNPLPEMTYLVMNPNTVRPFARYFEAAHNFEVREVSLQTIPKPERDEMGMEMKVNEQIPPDFVYAMSADDRILAIYLVPRITKGGRA